MATIKLIIEYDGTAYAGWQRQPNQPTIQETLETAITALTQRSISIIGAGRTDAGVHALGQIVSFQTDRDLAPRDWTRALNAHLPPDIVVKSAATMPDTFHARHSAKGKLYEYRILNRSTKPTIDRHFCWHIHQPLNDKAIQQAGLALLGAYDFSSFQTQPTDNDNPLCHLQQLTVVRIEDWVRIQLYADRFLKQMVRSIVGTLTEIGLGRRSSDSLQAILAAHNRSAAGKTAPPQGLFLVRVDYK